MPESSSLFALHEPFWVSFISPSTSETFSLLAGDLSWAQVERYPSHRKRAVLQAALLREGPRPERVYYKYTSHVWGSAGDVFWAMRRKTCCLHVFLGVVALVCLDWVCLPSCCSLSWPKPLCQATPDWWFGFCGLGIGAPSSGNRVCMGNHPTPIQTTLKGEPVFYGYFTDPSYHR